MIAPRWLLFALFATMGMIAVASANECTPPTPGPAPMPPDASDASTDPCTAACAHLAAMGCGLTPTGCHDTLAQFEAARVARAPDGGSVRCVDLAIAGSATELNALGVRCGR